MTELFIRLADLILLLAWCAAFTTVLTPAPKQAVPVYVSGVHVADFEP